ncbi:MAG: hypothetical protein PHI00_00715 [Atribacterota bacterium]|jgi:hypothetical protein|nr:hypothetical protein [Atribacterota bacterium]MDI9608114.1 hypothetical protein [Atribacterota bacterium]HPZ39644.1 hypothetical protein [Candidatus Atribacteria bacterium]
MVTHISSSFFPEVIYGVEDLAFRFAYNAEVSSLWGRREMPLVDSRGMGKLVYQYCLSGRWFL